MRITKPSKEEVSRFFEARINRDAIVKTLEKAKSLHLTESECQPIIMKRFVLEKEFKELKDDLIQSAIINSNFIDFQNGWYGIVVEQKNKTDLLVSPLTNIDPNDFICDFNVNSAKTRNEYAQLMEGKIEEEILNAYKNTVFRKRDEYINEFFGCENKVDKDGKTYLLTSHCIRRWKERICHNDGDMDVALREEYVQQITKSFIDSEQVYNGENGEVYFLDKHSMAFFVVTPDNVIATLWRNTFDFPDSAIDNTCTIMLLDHLRTKQKEYLNYKNEKSVEIYWANEELQATNEAINLIDEEIKKLLDEKAEMQCYKEESLKKINEIQMNINMQRIKLKNEEALLFKPHKVVAMNE